MESLLRRKLYERETAWNETKRNETRREKILKRAKRERKSYKQVPQFHMSLLPHLNATFQLLWYSIQFAGSLYREMYEVEGDCMKWWSELVVSSCVLAVVAKWSRRLTRNQIFSVRRRFESYRRRFYCHFFFAFFLLPRIWKDFPQFFLKTSYHTHSMFSLSKRVATFRGEKKALLSRVKKKFHDTLLVFIYARNMTFYYYASVVLFCSHSLGCVKIMLA